MSTGVLVHSHRVIGLVTEGDTAGRVSDMAES